MKDEFPVKNDLIYSFIISILLTLVFFFTSTIYIFSSTDFGIFITIIGIILGVLFTVLTVLYTFEDNLKSSILIKELKQSGKYKLIYPIFMDSVSLVFYSLILLLVAYFVRDYVIGEFVYYAYLFCVFTLLIITFIRSYRCFFVFSLLQKVMRERT
jgi:hypothetical protein